MESNEMIETTKEIFYNYIKSHNLTSISSEMVRGDYFIDNMGNKLAYIETSSYSQEILYKIKDGQHMNTLRLINTIFNGK